jgi:predicted alpha/beta-fold hydrolase
MVGLVTATMTMTYSAFPSCSTWKPLQSPALCITPFPPSVSAFSRAHPPIVSTLCVQRFSSSLVGWKQSVRSSSDFCVALKGRDSQVEVVSAFIFGTCDRVGRESTLWCRAMAGPSAVAAGSLPGQEFTFVNKKGLKVKGLLVDGGAGSKEVCILCHGFRSSKLSGTLSALSTGLAEAGVSTFRFDFSGNGKSEGKFAYGNYWQEVEDLRAAVEFLASKGSRVVCVAGHSKGGNCAVLYASKYHDVPCVINISGRFALEKGQCSVHCHLLVHLVLIHNVAHTSFLA